MTVAAAATLADHITSGAPAGVQVWQEGTVVAVFRKLDSPARRGGVGERLRAGMAEGRLFNVEFRQTEEIRPQ